MLVIGAELFVVVLVAGILASLAWSGASYGRLVCVGAVGAALLFGYDMVREVMAGVALGHIRYAMPVWGVVFVCAGWPPGSSWRAGPATSFYRPLSPAC